jgi:outer membrane protein assembly factor BamB
METGTVAALDLDDGRRIWSVVFDGWAYPPAVVGNVVVVAGRAPVLRALDLHSGRLLWERSLPNEAVYRAMPTTQSGVAVTTFSGHVLAFDSRTGRQIWSHREPVAQQGPVVGGGLLVFIGFDGQITARSAETGNVRWRADSGISNVQVDSDSRYLVVYRGMHDIRLLDLQSGAQVGVFPVEGEQVERAWIIDDHVQALSRGSTARLPRSIKVRQWTINSSKEESR